MNTPAPDVTGIAYAVYHVTDVTRARRFYGETLGLKVCLEMEFAPGQWWIEYEAGGPSALVLTNFESPATNATRSPGVALEVANFEETLARVRAAGVEPTWGPNEGPMCHCFAVKDPDGNDLYFHRRKPQA
jgi:catechol 2,3-dioxygenase-like lactoylglutathione lyase family enzyme